MRCLQLAFILLGGATACSLDEASAAVVAACPLGRARWVAVRAAAALVDVLVGSLLLVLWSFQGSVGWTLVAALVGCAVLGFCAAAVARLWLDEPGEVVASALVLGLVGVLLIEPIGRRLGLFPVEGGVRRATLSWGLVCAAGAASLVIAVPERRWHTRA